MILQFCIVEKPTRNKGPCKGDDDCCGRNGDLCGKGEGDCDKDKHCKHGLVCGFNNCEGNGFDPTDDCCDGKLLGAEIIKHMKFHLLLPHDSSCRPNMYWC